MLYSDFIDSIKEDLNVIACEIDNQDILTDLYHNVLSIPVDEHNALLDKNEDVAGLYASFIELSASVPKAKWVHYVLAKMFADDCEEITPSLVTNIAKVVVPLAAGGYKNKNSVHFYEYKGTLLHLMQQCEEVEDGELFFLVLLAKRVDELTALANADSQNTEKQRALGVIHWLVGRPEIQSVVVSAELRFSELLYRLAKPSDDSDSFLSTLPVSVIINANKQYAKLKKLSLGVGSPSSATSPVYSKLIYAFDSIFEMGQQVMSLPDGFALCVIINENISDSYFTIVCKNGENITILTDSEDYDSPLQQSRMAQRNDRYNAERHHSSYFPYEMLNINWSDNERSAVCQSNSTVITDPKTNIRVLGSIETLAPDSALWLSYLFECCYFAYFKERKEELPMSILAPGLLQIGEKKSDDNIKSTLPVNIGSKALVLPDAKNLNADELIRYFPDIRPCEENAWMERRFDKYVDSAALYPLDSEEVIKLEFKGRSRSQRSVTLKKEDLFPLPSQKIMTVEQATKASVYIGRHNKAQIIKGMVYAEFEDNAKNISDWVYRKICANVPNLIEDLASLNHSRFYESAAMSEEEYAEHCHSQTIRHIHLIPGEDTVIRRRSEASELIKRLKLYNRNGWADCYIARNLLDEEYCPSDLFLMLKVQNIWDLVNVTGVPRSNFPEELQHYSYKKVGRTSILNATDEMAGVTNPYDQLSFVFSLPVNKKMLNEYRSKLGLEKITAIPKNHWEVNPSGEPDSYIYDYLREQGVTIVYSKHQPDYSYRTTQEMWPVDFIVKHMTGRK